MAVVVALIYSRGYARTFWIGALFPTGVLLLSVAVEGDPFKIVRVLTPTLSELSGYGDPYLARCVLGLTILVAMTMIIVAGIVAIGVRWMVESPQRSQARQAALDAPQIVDDSEAKQ
jgi:uncharacterized protein (DUF2062 family)